VSAHAEEEQSFFRSLEYSIEATLTLIDQDETFCTLPYKMKFHPDHPSNYPLLRKKQYTQSDDGVDNFFNFISQKLPYNETVK